MSKDRYRENGYFLVLAVVFILAMGMMGVLITYLTASRAFLSVHQLNGLKTFYNAESGLEIATHYLWRPSLTAAPARITCAQVTGTAQLTNASFNGGTFTATTINSSPIYGDTTLNGAITASAATMTASSASGFAPSGRIMIDREAIDYAGISGNSFIGVTRGAGGTLASSHASGAGIGQYQCSLDVQAGIPSVASPTYHRELQAGVQLQDGWVAADSSGSNYVLSRWNYPTEESWTSSSIAGGSSVANMNAISMVSNVDGWATGDRANNNFIFLRWNGATWSLVTLASSCSNQHLNGISMVSANNGFAVGARYRPACASSGNYRYTILSWDGSAWSRLVPSSIPADSSSVQNLMAVHVIDTTGNGLGNVGFAVGNSGTILRYNGSTWVTNASGVTRNLTGVYTVSTAEAWAVGANGTILRWNGSAWSSFSSPTSTTLNAISMLDTDGDGLANFGVAVGSSAKLEVYNGSSWTEYDMGNTNLFGVDIFNADDAWAVGASGIAYHWDGAAWTSVSSGTTRPLNAISLVRQGRPAMATWKQVYG